MGITEQKGGISVAKTYRWEKLAGCPLHTENFGDSGYIFQDRKYWIAVTKDIDNGVEWDTPCDTRAEAKQVVEREAHD